MYPPESTYLGYLLTCYWCAGLWVSGFMILFYWLLPVAALVVAAILALSAIVGIIDHWMTR